MRLHAFLHLYRLSCARVDVSIGAARAAVPRRCVDPLRVRRPLLLAPTGP